MTVFIRTDVRSGVNPPPCAGFTSDPLGYSEDSRATRSRAVALRALGYSATQFNGVLVPLLVYDLTRSPALAGAALAVEWIPKIAMYWCSGSVLRRYGAAGVHRGLEIARLMCLAVLAAFAFLVAGPWIQDRDAYWLCAFLILSGTAAVMQCTNALSNVLFERLAHLHWPPELGAQGHARMMRADQVACLGVLLLVMILGSVAWAAVVSWSVQALCCVAVQRNLRDLHGDSRAPDGLQSRENLTDDIRVAFNPALLEVAVSSLLSKLPATFLTAMLVLLVADVDGLGDAFGLGSGPSVQSRAVSLILLLQTFAGALFMYAMRNAFDDHGLRSQHVKWSVILSMASLLGAALVGRTSLWVEEFDSLTRFALISASVVIASIGALMIQPWLRAWRQQRISVCARPDQRSGVTGVLISVEAASHLLAAALVSLSGWSFGFVLSLCAIGCLCASAWAYLKMGAIERTLGSVSQQP